MDDEGSREELVGRKERREGAAWQKKYLNHVLSSCMP